MALILDLVFSSLFIGSPSETGSLRNVAPEWLPRGMQSRSFLENGLELNVMVIGWSSGSAVPSPCRYDRIAPAMHAVSTSFTVESEKRKEKSSGVTIEYRVKYLHITYYMSWKEELLNMFI